MAPIPLVAAMAQNDVLVVLDHVATVEGLRMGVLMYYVLNQRGVDGSRGDILGALDGSMVVDVLVCAEGVDDSAPPTTDADVDYPLCDYMDCATEVDVRIRAMVADDLYGDGSHDDMDADVQTESERFPVHYYLPRCRCFLGS